MYPLLPSPVQSIVGTAWRDALGPTGLFAGGGGGAGGPGGSGGPGGGGPGAPPTVGKAVVNTGGGGGGFNPGVLNGGPGIVIIRYLA